MQVIFLAAVEGHRPEDWDAYLDQACAGDGELRRQVSLLLKAHREAGSVPGAAASGQGPTAAHQPAAKAVGGVIGPYKLLQQIGEGGMGTVFMAEQTQPVQRKVALKVTRPGMDSQQVIARFEAERQALALMDHPNIAKVLDAGATEDGRPYFVMELVKGVPITRYCDENRLPLKERLALFIAVCQAVQHAHQKGIIHRDLKPGNVLVARYDGKPAPKVIDFGIAKATGPKLTERTLFTEFGAVVGTLEYMSPEQAELNQLDIDTRSDVYSLGVLLYELLTGTTPLERKRLTLGALLESLRIIREEEPPKPSTRLSTTEGLASIAANRGLEPKALSGVVRGELDWIVMKALEKDRARRYDSANGLAADLERYLADEPVLACPPSAGYRLRKFARRHRRGLVTGVLFGAVLVGLLAAFGLREHFAAVDLSAALGKAHTEGELKDKANQELASEKEALRGKERQAKIELSTFFLDKGLDYCERGEVGVGMLWLARSLETVPDGAADLERVIRINLAAWRYEHVSLKAFFRMNAKHAVFSPDGGTITLVTDRTGGGVIQRLKVGAGVLVGSPVPYASGTVALSPDGSTALVGTQDGKTAQLRDVATGELIGSPLVHPESLKFTLFRKPMFSADGRTALTLTPSAAYLWSARTGELVGKPIALSGFDFDRTVVALSPDGRVLLTAGFGKAPKNGPQPPQLWDVTTGEPLGQPFAEPWAGGSAAFSPDGQFVAISGRLWAVATGKPVLDLGPSGYSQYCRFSPDGCALVVWGGKSAKVWGVPGDQSLWQGGGRPLEHASNIVAAEFSPDGRSLATACEDGAVHLWAAGESGQVSLQHPYPYPVDVVAFSPDGRSLFTAYRDGIRFWELPLPKRLDYRPLGPEIPTGKEVTLLALSPDGNRLVRQIGSTLGPDALRVAQLWDVKAGEPLGLPLELVESKVPVAAFSPDGQRVFLPTQPWGRGNLGPDGKPLPRPQALWLGEGGEWKRTVSAKETDASVNWLSISALAPAPDGRTVLARSGVEPMSFPWDVATWQPVGKWHLGQALAFSPDGKTVLEARGQEATLCDPATGQPLGAPLPHQGAVLSGTFSPDGRFVATGSADKTARLWDAATGAAIGLPLHHRGGVNAVAFSPDGRTLLTRSRAGDEIRIRFWDVAVGKALGPSLPANALIRRKGVWVIRPLPGLPNPPDMAFRADGRAVVLAGANAIALGDVPAPPLEGEAARLTLWAQLITERSLDASNVEGWLTFKTWDERRERLEELGGPPGAPLDLIAWRRREAETASEENGDWAAALWHLDRLVAAEPNQWAHYQARGDVYRRRHEWENPLWRPFNSAEQGRAGLSEQALEDHARALEDYSRAIKLGAKGADVWQNRGLIHAGLRRWDKAAADFRKAGELGAGHNAWCYHARALLEGKNLAAYRRACADLVDRFGQTPDPGAALDVARTCLWGPEAGAEPARIVSLAEKALAGEAVIKCCRDDDCRETLALALYRAGRFEAVIQCLSEAMKEAPKDRRYLSGAYPKTWKFLLAMAHQRLGHADEARSWLEKGLTAPPEGDYPGWYPGLRGEAEALLGPRPSGGPPAPDPKETPNPR
jgi:serine/threonine protein kinase/WD40 repeat protein/tetratricopeptide (TPR) repeat protein